MTMGSQPGSPRPWPLRVEGWTSQSPNLDRHAVSAPGPGAPPSPVRDRLSLTRWTVPGTWPGGLPDGLATERPLSGLLPLSGQARVTLVGQPAIAIGERLPTDPWPP